MTEPNEALGSAASKLLDLLESGRAIQYRRVLEAELVEELEIEGEGRSHRPADVEGLHELLRAKLVQLQVTMHARSRTGGSLLVYDVEHWQPEDD